MFPDFPGHHCLTSTSLIQQQGIFWANAAEWVAESPIFPRGQEGEWEESVHFSKRGDTNMQRSGNRGEKYPPFPLSNKSQFDMTGSEPDLAW